MVRPSRRRRAGLTLIELIVVLAILVAIAGVAVLNSGKIAADSQRIATDAVLREVRDAFVGSAAGPGYITDCGRAYDDDPAAPIDVTYRQEMRFLFAAPSAGVPATFDPVTKTGWRGPYLEAPARDGWGSLIVLQTPEVPPAADQDEAKRHARLVSAGPDRTIDTPTSWLGPGSPPASDDVIVFLEVSP